MFQRIADVFMDITISTVVIFLHEKKPRIGLFFSSLPWLLVASFQQHRCEWGCHCFATRSCPKITRALIKGLLTDWYAQNMFTFYPFIYLLIFFYYRCTDWAQDAVAAMSKVYLPIYLSLQPCLPVCVCLCVRTCVCKQVKAAHASIFDRSKKKKTEKRNRSNENSQLLSRMILSFPVQGAHEILKHFVSRSTSERWKGCNSWLVTRSTFQWPMG